MKKYLLSRISDNKYRKISSLDVQIKDIDSKEFEDEYIATAVDIVQLLMLPIDDN